MSTIIFRALPARIFGFVVVVVISAFVVAGESYDSSPVWVDVRSWAEYQLDHIEGDLRIHHADIVNEIIKRYPDKRISLNLYCAAGGRAEKARQALLRAGYVHVTNAGGIEQVRASRQLKSESD